MSDPDVDPTYDPTDGDLPATAHLIPDQAPDPSQEPVDLGAREEAPGE